MLCDKKASIVYMVNYNQTCCLWGVRGSKKMFSWKSRWLLKDIKFKNTSCVNQWHTFRGLSQTRQSFSHEYRVKCYQESSGFHIVWKYMIRVTVESTKEYIINVNITVITRVANYLNKHSYLIRICLFKANTDLPVLDMKNICIYLCIDVYCL